MTPRHPHPARRPRSRVSSGVHSSHARRAGSRVSNTSMPPGRSAALIPRNVAAQSSSVRKTWATLAVMNAASTLQRRQGRGVAEQPVHGVGVRAWCAPRRATLAAGSTAVTSHTSSGEHAREGAGAAADVEHRTCAQLAPPGRRTRRDRCDPGRADRRPARVADRRRSRRAFADSDVARRRRSTHIRRRSLPTGHVTGTPAACRLTLA